MNESNSTDARKPVNEQFTPGPWIVDPEYPRDVVTLDGRKDVALAAPNDEQSFANAHLIAAAPDLYAALFAAMLHMENDEETESFDNKLYLRLNQALKQARGEK